MTPCEAINLLIRSIINKSSCGKLTDKEREAADIIRKFIIDNDSNSKKEV